MPLAIQSAIKSMCQDAIGQAITHLADKYNFDPNEARRELNIDNIQILSAPDKKSTKSSSAKKLTSNNSESKRGKTGYLLYTNEIREKVKSEMQAMASPDEKIKPQAIISELAIRWKKLPDDIKTQWNYKAKEYNEKLTLHSPSKLPTDNSDSDIDSVDEELCLSYSDKPSIKKQDTNNKKEDTNTKKQDTDTKKQDTDTKKQDTNTKKQDTNNKKEDTNTKKQDTDTKKQDTNTKSGYLLFCKQNRSNIKAQLEANLESGSKLKPQDVIQELASQWASLSSKDKDSWNIKASNTESSD